MHESSTYQAILDEGREKEAKRIILRLGEKDFGPPSESDRAKLSAITDLDRLEALIDQISKVSSWKELLDQGG